MLLSETQLSHLTTLLQDSGFVRIVLDSQDDNTLGVTVKLDGKTFTVADTGITERVRVRPASDPMHYYREIPYVPARFSTSAARPYCEYCSGHCKGTDNCSFPAACQAR